MFVCIYSFVLVIYTYYLYFSIQQQNRWNINCQCSYPISNLQKCEGNQAAEWRKFSVDPQITSLEVLYSILAKAFDIKTDFSLSYKAIDPNGADVYLAVLSDWDLDAAFLRFFFN